MTAEKCQHPLSVKKKYSQGQVPRKGSPQDIGNLKVGGDRYCFFVIDNCQDYQNKHYKKPQERKKICPEIEKNQTPDKVEEETYRIVKKPPFRSILICTAVEPYKGRAYAHQNIKYCPDNGK